jgi:hypothetical protein
MIPGDDFAAAFLTLRFAAFLVVVLATAGRDLVPDFFALVAALEPLVVVFFAAFFFEAFDAERDFVLVRLFVLTMFPVLESCSRRLRQKQRLPIAEEALPVVDH